MTKHMTPAERAAAMRAMPMHAVYMTRGGTGDLITQTYCEVITESSDSITVRSVSGLLTIRRDDLYAIKAGRYTRDEVLSIHQEHAHKQRTF